jgi:sulfur carrier protein
MKIVLNGERVEVSSPNLQAALIELGYEKATVATALNGEFVSVKSRASVVIAEGDRLEVVAPMQGG